MTQQIEKAYQKEQNQLLAFIKKRVGSIEDAEDILQDIFYRTIDGISVTHPVENIIGWFYTSARNRIVDYYRKKRMKTVPFTEDRADLSLMEILPDMQHHPERAFFRKTLADEIIDCLDQLPEKQKSVFILHVIEGRSYSEISEITGDTVNTLISRKRYAVQSLQQRLKEIKEILDEF